MKPEFSQQIFEKYSNIKLYGNPSSENRVVPCRDMDSRLCPLQQLRTQLFGSSPLQHRRVILLCPLQQWRTELFVSAPCYNDKLHELTRQEISQKWKVLFGVKGLRTLVTVPHRHKLPTSSKPLLVDLASLISNLATFMAACGQCSASLTDKRHHVTLQDLPGVPTDPMIPGASIKNKVFQGHSKGSQHIKASLCHITAGTSSVSDPRL